MESYRKFIHMFNRGKIYISKKVDIYDYLESDDEDALIEILEKENIANYAADEFKDEFIERLNNDLEILLKIQSLWKHIKDDPKLDRFISELKSNSYLGKNKLIVFTESKETGQHLYKNLNDEFGDEALFYCSDGGLYQGGGISVATARELIKENFDPNNSKQKDHVRILITTDVLAEGENLHRSNIVINYDLPWNPTRVLQRVGRVNRVGTEHKKIYVYNFFPTAQSDEHLGLEANIKAKIQAFHDTLGEDARYITEEEIISTHELFGDALFKKLNDKTSYEGEEEADTESKYLKILRDIRDNSPELFEKIKRLPKKARSSRKINNDIVGALHAVPLLITFFRKANLKKFLLCAGEEPKELGFFEAVPFFECKPD
ncbi:MAG: C-terminal helicase domain-containing protein, partial [Thermodesulfobacteriota bacterium]